MLFKRVGQTILHLIQPEGMLIAWLSVIYLQITY